MSRKRFSRVLTAFLVLFLSGVVFGSESSLTLNVPVSREFKSGERLFFNISAAEGELMEVVCQRQGVDIGLTAFAPSGEKISVSNAPAGFVGFDRVLFIAQEAGVYKIEVSSRRPGDIAGSLTITLKDKRAASETDIVRVEAARLSGEARTALIGAENRYEKALLALEKLEKSLRLFEKTSDWQGQAETILQIAIVKGYEFGRKAESIAGYEKALEIWQRLDDEAGKAICLSLLADEFRNFDSPDKPRSFYLEKAQRYFDQALADHRKLGSRLDEAATLSSLCRFLNDTGKFQKAFEACRESLQITGAGNPLIDYLTYGTLASLHSNAGDAETALKYNRMALDTIEIVKDHINPYRKAFVKGNMGNILTSRREFESAERELREALAITEEAKWHFYSGYILVRLALILYETNRLAEALETAQKGVEYYRRLDPVKIQAALNSLGKIQLALGATDKARELFTEAVETNRRNTDRYAEAESLYNLARLEDGAGNLATARQHVNLAVHLSEAIRAELYGKNQRTTYLSILKKYYELEIEILIKLDAIDPAHGYAQTAWQRHERIRARSLMESLIESGLNLNEFAPKDYYSREQILLEAIAAEQRRSESVKSNDAQQRDAQAALGRKLNEHDVLQESFRKSNPRFSAINQPPDFTPADAQKLLDENAAILEFALGERQSYVWIICKTSFRLVKLPPKKEIEAAVRAFYDVLTESGSAASEKTINEAARNLSRKILAPASLDLKNVKQIIFIGDGALQLTPFSALTLAPESSDFEPLAERFEIVHAPSFASLVFLRENKANRAKTGNKLLAVFADPIFQADDERLMINKPVKQQNKEPKNLSGNLALALRSFGLDRLARLPFSRVEAREISKLAPEQTFLALGADASRQKFLRGDFNAYRYLHFATHGFLNQENPELSGLVLSLYDEKRNAQNGFLRVIDLYSMRLNSDLVVLSACQTALGKEIDGEGIVGLTRGFMYAGASGVVSSLWKVEDAATAELMKRFYRAMLKENQTPSAALRTAKLEMRRIPRFANPRFWAGFTLNGEWQ